MALEGFSFQGGDPLRAPRAGTCAPSQALFSSNQVSLQYVIVLIYKKQFHHQFHSLTFQNRVFNQGFHNRIQF